MWIIYEWRKMLLYDSSIQCKEETTLMKKEINKREKKEKTFSRVADETVSAWFQLLILSMFYTVFFKLAVGLTVFSLSEFVFSGRKFSSFFNPRSPIIIFFDTCCYFSLVFFSHRQNISFPPSVFQFIFGWWRWRSMKVLF